MHLDSELPEGWMMSQSLASRSWSLNVRPLGIVGIFSPSFLQATPSSQLNLPPVFPKESLLSGSRVFLGFREVGLQSFKGLLTLGESSSRHLGLSHFPLCSKKLKVVSEGVGDMGVRRLTGFVNGNQDHIRHLGDVLRDRLGRWLRLLSQGQKPQDSSRAQFCIVRGRWERKPACGL